MKKILSIIVALAILSGCSGFLDCPPSAVLSDDNVTGADAIEGLVISSYAALINDGWNTPMNLWPYMIIRSDDAYKGGSGTNDQGFMHYLEISESMQNVITAGAVNNLWVKLYIGIGRCNSALKTINEVDESEYPLKKQRIAEVKFLRAQFYIRLKVLFNAIPWVDETLPQDVVQETSNQELTSDELWARIYKDCTDAYADLPESQSEVGRPTKYAAAAAAARVALYRAYGQDEQWNFTSVSRERMTEVLDWTSKVLAGPFSLNGDFGFNFYPAGENSNEAIWSIQYSHADGTMYGRGNYGDGLVWPIGVGGCDFLKPSQNLVNAFKTNNGIPMFDNYDDVDYDYKNPNSFTVDPRLYHTVSMPTIAFKLTFDESQPNNNIYAETWSRLPSAYGYYATAKQVLPVNDPNMTPIPPFLGCALNKVEYRLDDVMLMRAEALVETGAWQDARELINQLRRRASTSTTYFTSKTNVPANINVREYTSAEWSSESFARQAYRWERRLELAMEGWRFFDLVRWGEAVNVLNSYFKSEPDPVTGRGYFYNQAKFDVADTYLPIPNNQIVLSRGVYVQNWPYAG